jgi:hypothetical protein
MLLHKAKQSKRINKHGIFFGLHLYRKPQEAVFYSCLRAAAKLLKEHGYSLDFSIVLGQPYIQLARNELVSSFLKSDSNIFVFIADDLEYSPEDLLRLVETPGEVVVGVYSLHTKPAIYPVQIYTDCNKRATVRKDGCISAKFVQTGFMRVDRTVFEKIAKAHPELEYYRTEKGKKLESAHDFFPQGVHGHSWIGEDYAFCKLWLGLGGKIWIQPDFNLTHYLKGTGYPGNFHEYLMHLPGGCKENKK